MTQAGKLRIVSVALTLFSAGVAVAGSAGAANPAVVFADVTGIDFGPVAVGSTVARTVTITNISNAPVTDFAGGGVGAPFNASQDCVIPGGLLPGKSCHYFFTFAPTGAGPFTATSASLIGGTNIKISLKGTGAAGRPLPSTGGINFGPVRIGTTKSVTVTIRNIGLGNMTNFAGGGTGAPFNASQDCVVPGGIKPRRVCHYFFTFTPTAPGPFSSSSNSVIDGYPVNISVTGSGDEGVPLPSATGIDFGPVPVGTTRSITITIRNVGLGNMTNFAGGGIGAPFNASQDCVVSGGIKPNHVCHYFITFAPTTSGVFSTSSNSIVDGHPMNIAIAGTGI